MLKVAQYQPQLVQDLESLPGRNWTPGSATSSFGRNSDPTSRNTSKPGTLAAPSSTVILTSKTPSISSSSMTGLLRGISPPTQTCCKARSVLSPGSSPQLKMVPSYRTSSTLPPTTQRKRWLWKAKSTSWWRSMQHWRGMAFAISSVSDYAPEKTMKAAWSWRKEELISSCVRIRL